MSSDDLDPIPQKNVEIMHTMHRRSKPMMSSALLTLALLGSLRSAASVAQTLEFELKDLKLANTDKEQLPQVSRTKVKSVQTKPLTGKASAKRAKALRREQRSK